MADYSAPRDTIRDFRFATKDQEGGSQVDQYNWTDGLTHGQWPTVQFFTAPSGGGTNVTSQFVKDITGDTITSATHKDPTGSSGVWRSAQGEYNVRVKPNPALAYATYYMRVSFAPTSTQTRTEDLTAEITVPGDIDPNTLITPDDVTRGWTTSLDDPTIEDMIEDATEEVYAYLEDHGVEDPEAYVAANGMPRTWRRAIIDATRCAISSLDLSAGTTATSIQEGTEKITYATTVKQGISYNPCDWMSRLDAWLKRNSAGRRPYIGTVTKRVGHTIVDGGEVNSDVIRPPEDL